MTNPPTTLMTAAQVSEQYGLQEKTLEKWRYEGRGPAYVKVGRLVRYTHDAIESWLQAQTVSPDAA